MKNILIQKNMLNEFDEINWIYTFFDNSKDFSTVGIDRVRNFSLLWNLFEAFACNKFANRVSIISAVDKINEQESIKKEMIVEHLEYFANRYFNSDGSSKEIFNNLNFRNNDADISAKQSVILTLTKAETIPKENLKSLLFILLRFRNNLFHGEKEFLKLNEQVDNFIIANDLLTKVLMIMKKNYMLINNLPKH